MSSSFSFLSMALLISLFALASLLASPTLSTSTDNTLETTGFKAALSHVDHGKRLTKNELLRRGIQRGEMRQAVMAQLGARSASRSPSRSRSPSNIRAPTSGSDGEFYMNFTVGTPKRNHSVYVDTDTDLIWISECDSPSSSYSKLSCSSDLCKRAGSCGKNGVCRYTYQLTNNTIDLATETFTLGKNDITKLGFSCDVPLKLVGAVGLGRGPLSLVSQMRASTFSYCLPSYDDTNKTGFVLVGSRIKTPAKMITTSLLKNNFFTSPYYINVLGISVNDVKLPIDRLSFTINQTDGTGGVIMDTGSTVTYLEKSIFDKVHNEVKKQIRIKTTNDDHDIGLPVCFTIKPTSTITYPNITFHLGGPDGSSDLFFPIENAYREYSIVISKKKSITLTCLAMNAAPRSDRGMSSLGNIQQQNTLVVFDLHKETVAFLPDFLCNKM
ncbi:hypothetical protein CASFOL_032646 [Castilleja foliolosa]|uniref:Peptidase A1 domain-containing protein n=1 Tax=Castilleja foliolosa TaxID=1961234 RepID=A0ABD3C4P5_9LAMI